MNLRVTRFRFVPPRALLVLVVLAAVPVRWSSAQSRTEAPGEAEVRARYTKYEYRIPMRDGIKLFTAVYVPKDTSQAYPFLMVRTPYSVSPYGADQYPKRLGPAPVFLRDGFIFVYQDVRGRFMSEGTFDEMTPHKDLKKSPKDVDESTDTYDTVEWLLHHVPGETGELAAVLLLDCLGRLFGRVRGRLLADPQADATWRHAPALVSISNLLLAQEFAGTNQGGRALKLLRSKKPKCVPHENRDTF